MDVLRCGGRPVAKEQFHSASMESRASSVRPPEVLQELLGYSQIGVTLDIYSHVMPFLQDEAAERMDKTLATLVRRRKRALSVHVCQFG